MGILKDRLCDTHFQSAQFCQSAQAADAGVSRIGFLLQSRLPSGVRGPGRMAMDTRLFCCSSRKSFHDAMRLIYFIGTQMIVKGHHFSNVTLAWCAGGG